MGFDNTGFIWLNGALVPWADAKIHVFSHVVSYGSSVFEGQRCYKTVNGPACFRLPEHTVRLFNSAKVYRMEVPFTREQINQGILDVISANELEQCYIRPIVYRGYNSLGVDPRKCPVDVVIGAWDWTHYFGVGAQENGVSVCVSSWNRLLPNSMPPVAKSGANYMNSQLIKLEAVANGYTEGIALDAWGNVSEGSGMNVFLVVNGSIITPPLASSILPGITRDSVMILAREMGYEVTEEVIPRALLYIADEVFFTGSATEVTPVTSVDKIPVGDGKIGPIALRMQSAFREYVEGRVPDRYGWLTPVVASSGKTKSRAAAVAGARR